MRVENHTGRITKIPVTGKNESGGVATKASVTLLPGVNDVDPDLWAKCEEIALVKSLIEMGARKGGIVVGDRKKSLKTLAEFPEKVAIETIEETVSVELLKGWQATEKREKVLAAIAAQFEAIDPKRDRPAQ